MIEILHYEQANKNKVIGFADIKVPILQPVNFIFRKIAHLQNGERKWFNLPTFSRDKPDGSPNFMKYAQFETEVFNVQLMEALHERVKEFCQKNNIKEIEPLNFDNTSIISSDQLPF